MDYGILKHVTVKNKRNAIYIPKHKKWIELSKLLQETETGFEYEFVKREWQDEFAIEGYIEDNFNELFVKPAFVEYPEPEVNEDEMMEFK